MPNPTPERAVRQIQRENATVSSPKPHPCSARNLLLGVFKKGWERPSTAEKLQKVHAKVLLTTPIGRDFTLVTAAGVEFKFHSVMLIEKSDTDLLHKMVHADAPKHVDLPLNFHPILMDRIVSFVYTSDYAIDPSSSSPSAKPVTQLTNENFNFHNSTFVPAAHPPSPATIALVGVRDCMFHLHMYSLGEQLNYPSLKSSAHGKLVEILIPRRGCYPAALKEVTDAVFCAPDSPLRLCADEDGVLQQLVVASVIGHERKNWSEMTRAEFTSAMEGPEYAGFWSAYNMVKEENADLMKPSDVARDFGEKTRKARGSAKKSGSGLDAGTSGSPLRGVLAAGNRTKQTGGESRSG
ncbi:hypothetical protein T440DRAFT_551734 [Plenodomus tracheiphilus IPT5]|uniref:BTB domain-containing protein n=1 Tax=Plenodomus tracheiphilus IPT5 TaxID=1408161 RepID=A0A6A7BGK3_9PLEO|nr:hypothetical protein T440DRAFT_551734 [Plenodomus tracheiphilus IPT5]